MKTTEIQQVLHSAYSREKFLNIVNQIFPNSLIFSKPTSLAITNTLAKSAYVLGSININNQGIKSTVALYEVEISEKVVIERNRIELRNLLRPYWKDIDAALIVFYQKGKRAWRFTFVSELHGFNAEGKLVKQQTEPKRYTYVLGENESCRTPAERLAELFQKRKEVSVHLIKEAFSVEKLSENFFNEYKENYNQFVEFLNKSNNKKVVFNNDEKAIRDFVKKLLGRIVFLYFLQKKGWLGVPVKGNWGDGDSNFLKNLFEQSGFKGIFYSKYLSALFFDTLNTPRKGDLIEFETGKPIKVPYLNGGLFEEDDVKQRGLVFPEKLFADLFNFFDKYNFTIYEDDPDDQTIAVDPEMLGHIFENLLEDNKDKGAFYTPKEIVHFMCRESLIQYLVNYFTTEGYKVISNNNILDPSQPELFNINEGRTGQLLLEEEPKSRSINREVIEHLLNRKIFDEDKKLVEEYITDFEMALDKVKICDPAIGSGAFPMGLLQEIFAVKQTLHKFKSGSLEDFNASATKLNIIQNSIYGVDIEKGAVDIARLRFWLSLVVDEAEPKPLPNLDYKIVVGNSLVSQWGEETLTINWDLDDYSGTLLNKDLIDKQKQNLNELTKLQLKFFAQHGDKKDLSSKISLLKLDILENQLSLLITDGIENPPDKRDKHFKIQQELYLKTMLWKSIQKEIRVIKKEKNRSFQYFDWKLNFPQVLNDALNSESGFDIVIGNPPYIQLQKVAGRLSDLFENLGYETLARTGDIYTLFYEKGWHLLKEKGILSFITSNKWMRAEYGKLTRRFFAEKTNPLILIDFAGQKIFKSATVDTNILLFTKDKNRQQTKACIVKKNALDKLSHYFRLNSTISKFSTSDSWTILSPIEISIKNKVEKVGVPLKDWDVSIYRGVLTGFNDAFVIDGRRKDELIKEDPKSAEIIRPIVRGRDIKRFNYNNTDTWIINTHNGIKEKAIKPVIIEDYPAIKRHLDGFQPELFERTDQGDTPYNLRNCAYMEEFFRDKIIYAEIMTDNPEDGYDFPCFAYDEFRSVVLNTAYIITGKTEELKYLLAVLNSKLGKQLVKFYVVQLQKRQFRMLNQYVKCFPVPKGDSKINESIISNIEKILKLRNNNEDYSIYEAEIEDKVNSLFGLNEEEISFINSNLYSTAFE